MCVEKLLRVLVAIENQNHSRLRFENKTKSHSSYETAGKLLNFFGPCLLSP